MSICSPELEFNQKYIKALYRRASASKEKENITKAMSLRLTMGRPQKLSQKFQTFKRIIYHREPDEYN